MRETYRRCSWRNAVLLTAVFATGVLASAIEARAVFVYSSDTVVTQNLSAPSESEGLDGWNLEASFGKTVINPDGTTTLWPYLAVPIDATHFITAQHIYNIYSTTGGGPPTQITYQGHPYDVATPSLNTTFFPDPNSDLSIYTLAAGQTFPSYATLYDESVDGPLSGKTVTVIGCGTTPGGSVVTSGGQARGWYWYGSDVGNQSWGQSVAGAPGSHDVGPAYFTFDFSGKDGKNAILTAYDSSGGVFVQGADGTWKLAGINYAATGIYSSSPDGSNTFHAALFDQRDFYYQDDAGNWVLDDGNDPDPGYSEASSISNELGWIKTWVPDVRVPEPGTLALLISGTLSLAVFGRFVRRRRTS